MNIKSLSVFFPVYNEEDNITSLIQKTVAVLEKLKLEYEILIINDGSSDNTKEVAENIAKQNSKIRVINHPKNLGYGEALKSGFSNAKYDTIVYTDGDGQFDFNEVEKFVEKLDNGDLILGYRIKRADNFLRILFAKGWALSLFLFFGLKLKDVDCGFKMVKREVLEKISPLESTRGGMINAELSIKAKKYGFRVSQVGVNHYPRMAGKSTGANIRVIWQSFADLLNLWWKFLNKLEFLSVVFILILAAFFRLYKIDQYMTFLGDEGRDALVIKDFLVGHHIPSIGPPTSIGNIYLGPFYYYMMAIPMIIFWLNPLAAAVQTAFIGIFTVGLIYYLGKSWFGWVSGAVAAFLYAISPITILYSRSSWNPNPAPFFTLLAIIGFYKAHQTRNFLWLSLTGFGVSAAVQMHYLALILVPIFGLLWLYELSLKLRRKMVFRNFIKGTILGVVAFFILIAPLIGFDFRHDFMNYHAVMTFFTNRGTTVNINPLNSLGRMPPIYIHDLIGRYLAADYLWSNWLISILVLVPILVAFLGHFRGIKFRWVFLMLGVWLFIGVLGLSLYKQTIYDHYLGFLNPAPYLLLGSLAIFKKRWVLISLGVLVMVLTVINLQKNPLLHPPNRQLQRTQGITEFVIEQSGGKPFNFALIAKNNYDSAYQFYLDQYGHKPKQVPFEKTDQLIVVCEDSVCDVVNHPKYEVAGFGMSKIDYSKEFLGVKVYRLVVNPSGKK